MEKTLKVSLGALKAAIIVIGAIATILILTNWDSTWGELSTRFIMENKSEFMGPLNLALMMSFVVMIICVAAALLFGIFRFATDIKKNMGALAGIVLILVIALVSYYGLASDVVEPHWGTDEDITASTSKLVGGGIYMFYILGGLALVAIVYTEISKIIK